MKSNISDSGSKTEILSAAATQISPVAKTLNIDSMGVTLPVEMEGSSSITDVPSKKEGKYDVVKEIGKGGMGKIFLWKDKDIQRLVATKMLLPEKQQSAPCLQRFFEEGQITGQLEHPNIVPIHEMGVEDGSLYFTMKYVKGQSLHQLISEITKEEQERKAWSTGKVLRVFQSICHAIEYAHSKNVVHRDLKPENIMLGNFGEVMVMDWGLAKVLGQGGEVLSEESITTLREKGGFQTITGQITGTPLYMAPEQARGEIESIDKRSDIYALGAILFEVITGKRCVEGSSVFEIITKVSQGQLIPVPAKGLFGKIEKELSAIVNKCLASAPSERYQNVRDLTEDVQRYLDHKEVSAYSYNIWEKIYNVLDNYRKEIILVVATTLFLTIVFTSWAYYQNRKRSEQEVILAEAELHEQDFLKDLELLGISHESDDEVVKQDSDKNTFPAVSGDMKKETKTNLQEKSPSDQDTDTSDQSNFRDDDDKSDTKNNFSEPQSTMEAMRLNEPIDGKMEESDEEDKGGLAILEKAKENREKVDEKNDNNDKKLSVENEDKKKEEERKKKFHQIKDVILKNTKKYSEAYEKFKLYSYRQKEAEAWWLLYRAAQSIDEQSYQEIARHQIQNLLSAEDLLKYEAEGLK